MSLRAVAGFLGRTFVLAPAEQARRLRSRLDRRVYDAKLRVKAVTAGALAVGGPHWLVFVIYPSPAAPALAPYHACVFDACRRLGVNLAVVTNATLSAPLRGYVLENCERLIERENVGQDFGAYKDAINLLSDRFGPSSHLILCNDSVYYDRTQIDELIARCLAHPGFGAVTETFKRKHHAQSYFLSFAPAVRTSDAFRAFWRMYLPLTTRKWAIGKGEVGLTSALRAGGFPPRPLWTPLKLRECLADADSKTLVDVARSLPSRSRRRLRSETDSAQTWDVSTPYRQDMAIPRLRLTEAIVTEVGRSNQTSIGGFAYRRATGFPVIKRDIYFRGLYPLDEIERLLAELDVPDAGAILADLRMRGRIQDLKVSRFNRYLYRYGIL